VQQPAGVLLRFIAALIDGVLIGVVSWVLGLVLGASGDGGFDVQGPAALIIFVLPVIYWAAMEATSGATVGKMVLGIQVVNENGTSPIGWGPAIIRNIIRIPLIYWAACIVGLIMMLTQPNQQRLMDKVAHTIVVKKATAAAPAA
jgi:uncharacterized RDD family membrane protein YckC